MNVKELQQWLNTKGANIVADGVGGPKTREAFIKVFTNKKASAVSEGELLEAAKKLGDTNTKRIKAVAKTESNGSGYFDSGLVKILWERHYFYKFVGKTIYLPGYKDHFLSHQQSGGYTTDFNKNNINDSWEKLAAAACIHPDGAFQSISVGKFQVMGKYYKELGYNHPIDMLWAATQGEKAHYDMLVGYILKVANLKAAFLRISTNPETCRDFAKGYNGKIYEKYDYHKKIANGMK